MGMIVSRARPGGEGLEQSPKKRTPRKAINDATLCMSHQSLINNWNASPGTVQQTFGMETRQAKEKLELERRWMQGDWQ